METYALEHGRGANPFDRRIAELIGSIGAPGFESAFFRVAHEATGCEHLTAFASSERAPARLVLAANRGARPVARAVAEKYLTHYWHLDPANLVCRGTASPRCEIAVHVDRHDIDHEGYRRDCYSSVDLIDRFSIVHRDGDETIRLNLYRSARRGRFVASDFAPVIESGDVMLALLAQHDARRPSVRDPAPDDLYRRRLRRIAPQLARRELDVCIGIVQGRCSEAIALALGISINTVLTYRKRAYARLGISSHNELMRLVLV